MRFTLDDKIINIYGNPESGRWIIEPKGNFESDDIAISEFSEICKLSERNDFCLIVLTVENWNSDLSPWNAKAVFGNDDFGDGASNTLDFITNRLVPYMKEKYPGGEKELYLCGYSLSGLFSLWAAYQTDIFSGVAAVSPSVWFSSWLDYSRSNKIKCSKVYLSLGDKEEKSRNPVLASVGNAIKTEYDILKDTVKCILEWNNGNHFVDSDKRMAKGISWLIKK